MECISSAYWEIEFGVNGKVVSKWWSDVWVYITDYNWICIIKLVPHIAWGCPI